MATIETAVKMLRFHSLPVCPPRPARKIGPRPQEVKSIMHIPACCRFDIDQKTVVPWTVYGDSRRLPLVHWIHADSFLKGHHVLPKEMADNLESEYLKAGSSSAPIESTLGTPDSYRIDFAKMKIVAFAKGFDNELQQWLECDSDLHRGELQLPPNDPNDEIVWLKRQLDDRNRVILLLRKKLKRARRSN